MNTLSSHHHHHHPHHHPIITTILGNAPFGEWFGAVLPLESVLMRERTPTGSAAATNSLLLQLLLLLLTTMQMPASMYACSVSDGRMGWDGSEPRMCGPKGGGFRQGPTSESMSVVFVSIPLPFSPLSRPSSPLLSTTLQREVVRRPLGCSGLLMMCLASRSYLIFPLVVG